MYVHVWYVCSLLVGVVCLLLFVFAQKQKPARSAAQR
jgi:hypothetical protein